MALSFTPFLDFGSQTKHMTRLSSAYKALLAAALLGLALGQSPNSRNPDPQRIVVRNRQREIEVRSFGLSDDLLPSGDSVDYRNLAWARDNVAVGGTILLTCGDNGSGSSPQLLNQPCTKAFHINRPFFFEAARVTIAGESTNRTIIALRGAKDASGEYVFPKLTAEDAARYWPSAHSYGFYFVNKPYVEGESWKSFSTDVILKDFTILALGKAPVQDFNGDTTRNILGAMVVSSSTCGAWDRATNTLVEHYQFTMKRVRISGQRSDDIIGTNLQQAMLIIGGEIWSPGQDPARGFQFDGFYEGAHHPVNMVVSLEDNVFENTWLQAINIETPMSYPSPLNPSLTWPDFSIGGQYPRSTVSLIGNRFTNCARGTDRAEDALFVTAVLGPSDSDIVFQNNVYEENSNRAIAIIGGLDFVNSPFVQSQSQVSILGNRITMVPSTNGLPSTSGIVIVDLNPIPFPGVGSGIPSVNATIAGNTIHAKSGFRKSLIEHASGQFLFISQNVFSREDSNTDIPAIDIGSFNLGQFYAPTIADVIAQNDYFNYPATRHIVLGPGSVFSNVFEQPSVIVSNCGYNPSVTATCISDLVL